jgi:hypothetical protein
MLTTLNTRWEATQRVMAARLTKLIHKIAIQPHLLDTASFTSTTPYVFMSWCLGGQPCVTGLKTACSTILLKLAGSGLQRFREVDETL